MKSHLSVTRHFMQERAKITAGTLGIAEFSASNGYIEKFIRRNKMQRSVKLHDIGSSAVPSNYEQRMEEIRSVSANYPLRSICYIDESGLFYRMGHRISYISPLEQARTVRGTELQKQKASITINLSCNADGTHILPVRYIGSAKEPLCCRENRFSSLKNTYSSQQNAWMDSNQFDKWIYWWQCELRKVDQGGIFLIMDNCGGHESAMQLPGLRVEFIPPNCMSKNHPLDLD